MRVNKLHSSLSIAAVTLLAAIVPGVAQAQTNGPREEASSLIAIAGSDLKPSFTMNNIVAGDGRIVTSEAERGSFNPVVPAKPQVTLSAAAFKIAATPAVGEGKPRFSQQFELFQTTSTDSRKPYRGDDDLRIERSKKRIEFVPSMGLRMPYQN